VSAFALSGISFVWFMLAFLLFLSAHTLIPFAVPIAGCVLPASVVVLIDQRLKIKRERARQTRLFRSLAARPLALEIERRLLAELGLAGKRMTVTIMACQLTDFIESLEDDNPEEILQSLNERLALMMQSVGGHGGLVERIWNCGIIGLWGAPIEMDESKQARQAAACVIDINKRMREFQQTQTQEQQPARLTCSINTGEAICGTINAAAGDSILTHYGALGPCVDAAIQLESHTFTYGITCMVGGKTAQLLADQ
jgi:class 3 adenylate cyclase